MVKSKSMSLELGFNMFTNMKELGDHFIRQWDCTKLRQLDKFFNHKRSAFCKDLHRYENIILVVLEHLATINQKMVWLNDREIIGRIFPALDLFKLAGSSIRVPNTCLCYFHIIKLISKSTSIKDIIESYPYLGHQLKFQNRLKI